MKDVLRDASTARTRWRCARGSLWLFASSMALGAACSESESDGGECIGGDGAVAGTADTHCQGSDGMPIVQAIGQCVLAADLGEAPEEEGKEEEHSEEEEHAILSGREADDDDCKYHVRFENTCVAVDAPVTFTLSLTRKADGMPGAGTAPSNPEIFLADDETHISPSNNITATEGPVGTYKIGPVIFDQSGRWVVRFHYFETCSDIPEDSPHGHVAFYFDVP